MIANRSIIGFLFAWRLRHRRRATRLQSCRVVLHNQCLLLLFLLHFLLVLEDVLSCHFIDVPGFGQAKLADVSEETLICLDDS